MNVFKRIQPSEYFKQHIEQDLRVDGRNGLETIRPISITSGSIETADGSAIIKKGNTIVSCGIKLELSPSDIDDETCENFGNGFILVPNVDFPPICNSQYRPGPPPEDAQVASLFLKEVLENSDIIAKSTPPFIKTKSKRIDWVLYIDVICLNHDGNILDASVAAVVAALNNLTVPKLSLKLSAEDDEDPLAFNNLEDVISVDIEDRSSIELKCHPVSVTCGIVEDKILVDPTFEEEKFCTSTITFVLDESNNIVHCYKPGGDGISRELIQKCTTLAKKQAKQVRQLITKASKVKY